MLMKSEQISAHYRASTLSSLLYSWEHLTVCNGVAHPLNPLTPPDRVSELTGGGKEPMDQQPPSASKTTDIAMSDDPAPNTLPPSVAPSNTAKTPMGLGQEATGGVQPPERTTSTLDHQSVSRWLQAQAAEGTEKAASPVAQRKSAPPPLSINSFLGAVASVTSSAGRCLIPMKLTVYSLERRRQ
nr:unnamed protein product [Spirometra erinaceieuropaei]